MEKDKYINYVARDNGLYIWVLDFEIGEVLRYNVSSLGNEENGWAPDSEKIEEYLYDMGHSVGNCEWMVTRFKRVIK